MRVIFLFLRGVIFSFSVTVRSSGVGGQGEIGTYTDIVLESFQLSGSQQPLVALTKVAKAIDSPGVLLVRQSLACSEIRLCCILDVHVLMRQLDTCPAGVSVILVSNTLEFLHGEGPLFGCEHQYSGFGGRGKRPPAPRGWLGRGWLPFPSHPCFCW